MKSSGVYGDEITSELGEKVLYGIAQAVATTKADLTKYRTDHPEWVATHSERGLANWIHDRLWAHLVEQLDDDPDVHFSEAGPTREFRVGMRYIFRAKRHHLDDRIASYPTAGARAFWSQDVLMLFPGASEIRLAAGYRWDSLTRTIEDAVISLRDGVDDVLWAMTITFAPVTGVVELRPVDEDETPALPFILLDDEEELGDTETGTAE